jgi:hypothetical protein
MVRWGEGGPGWSNLTEIGDSNGVTSAGRVGNRVTATLIGRGSYPICLRSLLQL